MSEALRRREKGLEKKPFGQNLFRQLRQKTHESQRKRGKDAARFALNVARVPTTASPYACFAYQRWCINDIVSPSVEACEHLRVRRLSRHRHAHLETHRVQGNSLVSFLGRAPLESRAMGGDEHVNGALGFARTPTRHALTETNASEMNAPSSAAKLASFKGRYVRADSDADVPLAPFGDTFRNA